MVIKYSHKNAIYVDIGTFESFISRTKDNIRGVSFVFWTKANVPSFLIPFGEFWFLCTPLNKARGLTANTYEHGYACTVIPYEKGKEMNTDPVDPIPIANLTFCERKLPEL